MKLFGQVSKKIIKDISSIKLSKNKKVVNLVPIIELSQNNFGGFNHKISFYVGLDKLYKIRKLNSFLNALKQGEKIELGKSFTFSSNIHTFGDEENEFIKFIQLIAGIYESTGKIIDDTGLSLSSDALITAFELISKCDKYKITKNKNTLESKLIVSDLNLPIEFSKSENRYVIDFEKWQEIIPLTKDFRIVFYEKNIYVVSPEQAGVAKTFYDAAKTLNRTSITLQVDDKTKIVENIMPKLRYLSDLSVDSGIRQDIIITDLIIKIYLELSEEKFIKANVVFSYDDVEFNHFANEKPECNNKVLLRDKRKENTFILSAAKMGFTAENGYLYIKNPNKIYEFLSENLNILAKNAEIYFSKDFDSLKIISPEKTYGKVSINSGDLLEFDINIDDIPAEEISDVLLSLREKKHYYRLKNGNFVNLQTKALNKLDEITENIRVKSESLSKINIDLSGAMYVSTQEDDLFVIKREKSFEKILNDLKEPQNGKFKVPKCLEGVLRQYQVEGFKWLKTMAHYGFGGILADEMGLGKTVQTIAFIISEYKTKKIPSLIIVPTSLLFNWQAEFEKFAPGYKIKVVYGLPEERKDILENTDDCVAVVTSYGLIRKDIKAYSKRKWAYCILDEAQHIKNSNTVNAKSVKQIKADGYFAVTGTPIENNLAELWSIFDFIMPGYLFSRAKYRKLYEVPIIKKNDPDATSMLLKHINPFILRRLKSAVTKDLPEKIETYSISELEPQQKMLYSAYALKAKEDVINLASQKGFEKSKIEILAIITRLRQLCCHPSLFVENYDGGSGKLNTLLEIVENGIASGKRILVFSQFTSMLDIIADMFRQMGITYFYLDGSTKSAERVEMCNAFNMGQRDVFLISLKAGGTGLNLMGADTVIHYDPWWNPAVENQATDRAHRIGQTKVVQVIKLVAKGTIEEKIQNLKEKKQQLISSVLSEGGSGISSMTLEEIKELFD